MNIVDACQEDISLQDLSTRAECTVKTIRRAIGAGELPRRYVLSPRGPRLVFRPDEVERWISTRRGRRRRRSAASAGGPSAVDPAAATRSIAQIEALGREHAAVVTALQAESAARERTLADLQTTIGELAERLRMLEEQASGSERPATGSVGSRRGS